MLKTCVVCYRYGTGAPKIVSVKDGDTLTVVNPYTAWQKSMQDLGQNRHPGYKVSIEFRDTGATVQAVCWFGDGFNTPSGGDVIGTYTK